MGVFNKTSSKKIVFESPQELFRHLKKDIDIKFLWSHQDELLENYCKNFIVDRDVCFELPTGSGKSLVGLLIAEYRRIKENKRVVYLSPTKQLCTQIKNQADKYGIQTALLIGKQKDYDEQLFIKYQRAQLLAISTYSGVFNINPRISDADLIICDDAHAGDAYVSSFWTININRAKDEEIFINVLKIIKKALDRDLVRRLNHSIQSSSDSYLIDLLPKLKYRDKIDTLSNYFNECFNSNESNYYAWQKLSCYLEHCNIYVNVNNIVIRPLISPTKFHHPFSNAKQRIFMSASIGLAGDLERAFGIANIRKVPLPKHWEKRNTGRRLLIFPELATTEIETNKILDDFKVSKDRKLILTNNNEVQSGAEDYFNKNKIFTAKDIENSLEPFTSTEEATLILANRYDGIDLPDDKCRKLLILGFPGASSFQERFFVQRLGSTIPLRSLINTRITQGLGRCTRNENDYALILLYSKELLKWLSSKNYTKLLNPELQSEIEFGLDFSQDLDLLKYQEAQKSFLERDVDWDNAEVDIQNRLSLLNLEIDETISALSDSSTDEINYVYALFVRNYEDAYLHASKVVEKLSGGSDLSIYRMFWFYLKAECAYLNYEITNDIKWLNNATDSIRLARKINYYLPWMNDIYKLFTKTDVECIDEIITDPIIISTLLDELQLRGKKFTNKLKESQKFISSKSSKQFENALELLGKMCGFNSKNWNSDGSPDGLWQNGNNHCFVFEAKNEEDDKKPISLTTVRQALTHQDWLLNNKEIDSDTMVITVLITNQKLITSDAKLVCGDLYHITQEDVIQLYKNAEQILTNIRMRSNGLTEEERRAIIIDEIRIENNSFQHIQNLFMKNKLNSLKTV